jgi:hypothetical protein
MSSTTPELEQPPAVTAKPAAKASARPDCGIRDKIGSPINLSACPLSRILRHQHGNGQARGFD